MMTSLPILQFESFIMEAAEKLNLGIRWKKYLTKFENFLVAMNIRAVVFSCKPFPNILKYTGTTNETFHEPGEQDSFRHLS